MPARLPEDLDRILHDLRGPLNAAAMHVEVLKRVAGAPAAADSLKTLQHEIERLGEMLATAMTIVGIERGAAQPIDLRDVVDAALKRDDLRSVEIGDGAWPRIVADENLLVRAVTELALNAVEATATASPGTAQPRISASSDDGRVAITVRDFGPGLRSTNPKVLVRLGSSTKPGHRGVGLLISERIARLHGGTLAFASPGVGAEVSLVLPE